MKNFVILTAAMVLGASFATAQTTTGNGAGQSSSTSNSFARGDIGDSYAAAIDGGALDEQADAFKSGVARAVAPIGPNFNFEAAAGGAAGGGVYQAQVDDMTAGNSNIQFQVGNGNQAANIQVGTAQASATLQVGDNNDALISQTSNENRAAIMQLGELNDYVIVQRGVENSAAATAVGDSNISAILQSGNHNAAAHLQDGDLNDAVTFQNNGDNMAAHYQKGNSNDSFVSQGGGASGNLPALDGTDNLYALQANLGQIGAASGAASVNAAASVQMGDFNSSGIIQQGNGNEAVNFQSSL